MENLSKGFILTFIVALFVFGYFQGVVVPKVASKYIQEAAVVKSDPSLAGVAKTLPCNPTQTKCGKLVIKKDTQPDSYQDFTFVHQTIPGYVQTFILDDDTALPNPSTLSNTAAFYTAYNGTYVVAEVVNASYNVTITCSDPTGGTTVSAAIATISIYNGESVTCTFKNVPVTAACTGEFIYAVDQDNNTIKKFNLSGTLLSQWGTALDDAFGIAVSNLGNVYVTKPTVPSSIKKFNSSGVYSTQWTGPSFPYAIATSASGDVYIGHRQSLSNEFLRKYNSSGTFLTQWGGFSRVNDVAVDSTGNIYVVDPVDSVIKKLNSSGVSLTQWGGFGQYNMPISIAISPSGNVYVSVAGPTNTIRQFSSSGVLINQWVANYASGRIAVDSLGNVYVVDANNGFIKKYTASGTYLSQLGNFSFSSLTDIAIGCSN